MTIHPLALSLLPEAFAVCRFAPGTPLPEWVQTDSFFSFSGTPEETSLVCSMISIPSDVKADRGWRCFKIQGPLPFSLVGVLNSVTVPLAQAHISIFAVSTYDTDYILIKESVLPQALSILTDAGHTILPEIS
ncbi:MAG TPA: ACT domain-containing protein [Ktedonobacteraceae bacterium]|nr:ACT domain-containing protein [Ktedonobacteraceae bacterium]